MRSIAYPNVTGELHQFLFVLEREACLDLGFHGVRPMKSNLSSVFRRALDLLWSSGAWICIGVTNVVRVESIDELQIQTRLAHPHDSNISL